MSRKGRGNPARAEGGAQARGAGWVLTRGECDTVDGTTTRREVQILDRVAALLCDPERWCQFTVQKGNRLCLVGAISMADTESPYGHRSLTPKGEGVVSRMAELSGKFESHRYMPELQAICAFNNTSTHAEVLDLVARARASFERETVDAV